jgi:nitrogen fixation/metabolism regulation signal transduction histidine kinase
VGFVLGLLVWTGGRVLERIRLGSDDDAAKARVEVEVRGAFDDMARSLKLMAAPVADAGVLRAAQDGDTAAARRLFNAAAAALAGSRSFDVAVTAYSADGRPIAWNGRPSELPAERIGGGEAWFLAEGALGLRLVYIVPVVSQADSRRLGAVAAERSLAPPQGVRSEASDEVQFPSSIAPVSIQPGYAAARTRQDDTPFDVMAPSSGRLLTAVVSQSDLRFARQWWRRATMSCALMTFAAAVLILAGPLLDWRNTARTGRQYAVATFLIAAISITARFLLRLASPADWSVAPLFSASSYASAMLRPLLTSPFDFLLSAVAAGSLVVLGLFAVEAWRITSRRRRLALTASSRYVIFALAQLAAGVVLAMLLHAYQGLLADTIANTTVDLLHFSLHPWSSARLALQAGLIVWHASVLGFAVLVLRAAVVPFRIGRGQWVMRLTMVLAWLAPLVGWQIRERVMPAEQLPLAIAAGVAIGASILATRLKARYRHGSQAFRLAMLASGLIVPAMAFYPSVFQLAWHAKTQLVETRFAPQALNQRQTIQLLLQQSLGQIDSFPGLDDLVTVSEPHRASQGSLRTAPIDQAFQVWRVTSMAGYPLTSSVELYGRDRSLVSRFAFNLPEDLTAPQKWQEPRCEWDIYEEVSPFFAEERRVLHAGRAICAPDASGGTLSVGSVVVHAMLDYANLPFITSQTPYVELLRPDDPLRREGISGRDVEYAVYGWSRTPLYASGDAAWPLTDAVFTRVVGSRRPLWAELRRGDESYDVYLVNDRFGIYALGFPILGPLGHLVNLAELTVLVALVFLWLLTLSMIFGAFSRRGTTARALLREVRASFYRKLFLAFVLAAVLPVVALALVTRAYVTGQIRASIESEAVRTAMAARRVVEDLAAPRAAQQGVGVDDNLMVWVSRLISQDVNIFGDERLLATSERNLFASGLLPTRTPSDVYRALALQMEASTVTQERIGTSEYMVAATAISARQLDAMLTVPLTSRQQEIDREIDTLDRRVLLAALLFILGGAGIGYYMAERIADPVSRLTRATGRIARGDLDARIAVTSSDELRRLVEDFNSMARELQRQQRELERTHRLEAWAEMARQVAHEIKNPLTPIQLNAEHLRRVHADRGEPLGPMLQECVATILHQVTLLRQIAAEFSSFASSPTARPSAVDLGELLREIVDPYRAGLHERILFTVDVPLDLPSVHVDRRLVSRALANIIENALHAMPGKGTLTVIARNEMTQVRVMVSDTGTGMDLEALSRAFEPYFSTKAAGTGLGLPIAKRNVELNGGTIDVRSQRDRGTSVEITLPAVAMMATKA